MLLKINFLLQFRMSSIDNDIRVFLSFQNNFFEDALIFISGSKLQRWHAPLGEKTTPAPEGKAPGPNFIENERAAQPPL